MKYFYIGLLILCLLFSACYFSMRQIQRRTAAALIPLRRALESSRSGSVPDRDQAVTEAERVWRRNEPVLEGLLSHERTLAVTDELVRLRHAKAEDFEQICVGVMEKLRRLAELDLPRLQNIL